MCLESSTVSLFIHSNRMSRLLQLSQARSKLQAAIDESHPAPPAKYLRASAAACLLYGLQSVPLGFRMNAVLCTQVTSHVQAECPDKPDVLQRLQNSKYFEVIGLPGLPDQFLLDLHAIIMPHQLPQVTDILASMNPIHPQPHEPPQTKTSPDPPESTQLTVPLQVRQTAAYTKPTVSCQKSHASFSAGCRRCKGRTANRCCQKPRFPHSHMVEGNCCCVHRHGFETICLRVANAACHLPALSHSHAAPVPRA